MGGDSLKLPKKIQSALDPKAPKNDEIEAQERRKEKTMSNPTLTAIVTGASGGIGTAVAKAFIEHGYNVVLSGTNQDRLNAAAANIRSPERVLSVVADVADPADRKHLIEQALSRFGRLDVLVNNAGVAILKDVEETTLEEWRDVMAVNLDGVFLGCKHGVAAMKETGGGSIINMSSVSGLVGGYNLAAYNASKGGVRLLTKSVALHCARRKYAIRCNSVHPSFVDTPMVRAMIDGSRNPERAEETLKRQIPLGRLGHVDDVAAMVLYLASDESAFVTGAEMVVDGGLTA